MVCREVELGKRKCERLVCL